MSIYTLATAANVIEVNGQSTMYSKLLSASKQLDPKQFVNSDKTVFLRYFDLVYIQKERTNAVCNAVAALSGLDKVAKQEASVSMYLI